MKVRIGIDVGGTFTDAVAINDETYELIGSVKVPTTHEAEEGVAAGVIDALKKIMTDYRIKSEDIVFIAHGTTQATNALLEGDVAKVGILALGSGFDGRRAKKDTVMGRIELANNKFLETSNEFVDSANGNFTEKVQAALEKLQKEGANSIVAAEAFSVDNPENEEHVVQICTRQGTPVTATNDVSKLYGLKVRTKTAVVNASILPKMLEVANMTENAIKNAQIEAPLMVMRCDGGVMAIDELRSRPILTILSGPAAGVAGALMYEKLTDGIFLEVGGTSTDISCVKDGSVVMKYAEVGGHKTYLNSLDIRTVGVGGGSMVEIRNGQAVDVGPRSAHIAGLDYEVFAESDEIVDPVLQTIRPTPTDTEYAYVECANGKKFALTLSGAANICGYVKPGDYAYGNVEAAKKAWQPLAENMGLTVEEAARKVLGYSAAKNGSVVNSLIEDYGLDKEALVFLGGGGGAASVVPHLAESMGCEHKIAKNGAVISPIGVALAMVRDMVERTISNPTEEDILAIRREAIQMAIQSGAKEETIEVKIKVDAQHQKVTAIATGATEFRTQELGQEKKSIDELKQIVAENLKVNVEQVKIAADNGYICAMTSELHEKYFLFFRRKLRPIRLIERDGIIRLQRRNGTVRECNGGNWKTVLEKLLQQNTNYGDGGAEIPNIYIVLGSRIIDVSGLQDWKQIMTLCEVELAGICEDEQLIMVCTRATDNERG